MKPRVYLETSVFSYLTARDSSSLVGASRQHLTRRWWERRQECELFVSEVVLRECKDGDAQAAARRMQALNAIPLLSLTPQAAELATLLITESIMPAKAAEDALHIANPVIQAKIAAKLGSIGLMLPFICPPEELLGEDDE
ncbi:MAG: hypothetical protein AUJ20_01600 [Comamonadaceae bacterium CG1_02_60_18]|nr:MAG: hypothetical protein AUJ20_01600 [Comamonadaceae bacterium CG1_02_60_18]PIQ51745.1 MAG: hypothetical protein COW02_13670 [Comamonadaceae bacterium CG12_big_fil_rev_8_21_14_0_65_59_15]